MPHGRFASSSADKLGKGIIRAPLVSPSGHNRRINWLSCHDACRPKQHCSRAVKLCIKHTPHLGGYNKLLNRGSSIKLAGISIIKSQAMMANSTIASSLFPPPMWINSSSIKQIASRSQQYTTHPGYLPMLGRIWGR